MIPNEKVRAVTLIFKIEKAILLESPYFLFFSVVTEQFSRSN